VELLKAAKKYKYELKKYFLKLFRKFEATIAYLTNINFSTDPKNFVIIKVCKGSYLLSTTEK